MSFAATLRDLRSRAGHLKARSFHSDLARKGVDCNYAYYMKMEAGDVTPSAKIIEQIAQALDEPSGRELIMSYCAEMFPVFAHLFSFEGRRKSFVQPEKKSRSSSKTSGRELTRRQVAVLASSKSHYHVFLLLTLARRPLSKTEIMQTLVSMKNFQQVIDDLESNKLVRSSDDAYRTLLNEHQFPAEADYSELKPFYRKFDEWDEQFSEDTGFENHLSKMVIRRISPRYLDVIEDSLNSIIKLIRASDELDPKYNDSLVQVRLSLKSGQLPG